MEQTIATIVSVLAFTARSICFIGIIHRLQLSHSMLMSCVNRDPRSILTPFLPSLFLPYFPLPFSPFDWEKYCGEDGKAGGVIRYIRS